MPIVAVLFVALMLGLSYYPAARVQYREVRQKAQLETELARLKQRNERLRQQVARLKTPEGIEDLARTRLGLVKKGENLAVIVDGSATSSATSVPKIVDEVPRGVAQQPTRGWTAFLDAVFGVGN